MIDWNNNGKIDGEDLFLTDVLLENGKGGEEEVISRKAAGA